MFLGVSTRECVKMPPFARQHHPARTFHDPAEQIAVVDLLPRETPRFQGIRLAHDSRTSFKRIEIGAHIEQIARTVGEP